MKIKTFVEIHITARQPKKMVLRKFNKRADRMTGYYLTINKDCPHLSLDDLEEDEADEDGLRYEDVCVANRRMMSQMTHWATAFTGKCQPTERDTKFTRTSGRIFAHLKRVLDSNLGCASD